MIFSELYNTIKSKPAVYEFFSSLYEDFVDYMVDLENEEAKKDEQFTKEDYTKHIGLSVELTRVCYNKCEECCYPPTGEYLDLKLLKPLLNKTSILDLTGGDPYLHPDLKSLLQNFAQEGEEKAVLIITGGLNPKVNEDIKKLYYENLEHVVKEAKHFNNVRTIFSYLGGVKLNTRLLEFFKQLVPLVKKYEAYNLLPIIRIISDSNELKKKTNAFYKVFEDRGCTKEDVDCFLHEIEEGCIVRLLENNITFNISSKCHIYNALHVDVNGYINPCCSIHAAFKPIPSIAHITEPFEVIMDKRRIYLGLLRMYQTEKNSCSACVNQFPLYLKTLNSHPEVLTHIQEQ